MISVSQIAFLAVIALSSIRVVEGSECKVADKSLVGNGWCNYDLEGYNTKECMWDGGDCCAATCRNANTCSSLRDPRPQGGTSSDPQCYECGVNGFSCLAAVDSLTDSDKYVVEEEQMVMNGVPDTFPYYAARASLIHREIFNVTLTGRLCGSTADPVATVPLNCLGETPREMKIEGVGFTARHPVLGGQVQNVVCAREMTFEFTPTDPVTLLQIQIHMDFTDLELDVRANRSRDGLTELSAVRRVNLEISYEHSLEVQGSYDPAGTYSFDLNANVKYRTFSFMSLKGAKFTRLEISDATNRVNAEDASVCVNFLTLYTSDVTPDAAVALLDSALASKASLVGIAAMAIVVMMSS